MAKELPKGPPYIAFIGNLPLDAVQGDIEHIFTGLKISEVRMMHDRDSDKFRGFAFVEFESSTDLQKGIELDGAIYDENALKINVANQARSRRNNSTSRGGGRDGPGHGLSRQRFHDERGRPDRRYDGDNCRYNGDNRRYNRDDHRLDGDNRRFNGNNRRIDYGNNRFNGNDRYSTNRGPRRYSQNRPNRYSRGGGHSPKRYESEVHKEHHNGEDQGQIEHHQDDRPFINNNYQRPRYQSGGRRPHSNFFQHQPPRVHNGMNCEEHAGKNGEYKSTEQRSRIQSRTFFRGGARRPRKNEPTFIDVQPSNDPGRQKLILKAPEQKDKDKEEAETKARREKLFQVSKVAKVAVDSEAKGNDSSAEKHSSSEALDSSQQASSGIELPQGASSEDVVPKAEEYGEAIA